MKRLLVLSIASMLGTGCVVSNTCDRVVRFTWSEFLLADGSPGFTCSTATFDGTPVQFVDIFVDGGFATSANCTRGFADVSGIGGGSHSVTLEGVASDGKTVLTRDEFFFDAPSDCVDTAVDSTPAEGFVDLNYHFVNGGVDACVAGSELWLHITDTLANVPAYNLASHGSARACSGHLLELPIAAGTYRFDWMEEHLVSNGSLQSSECTPQSFEVGRATTTPVPVTMDVNGSTCPK